MSRDAARRWRPGQRSFCNVAANKVFFNTHTYGTRSPPVRGPPSLFRCPMPSLDLCNDMVQRACRVSTGVVDTVGGLYTALFGALTAVAVVRLPPRRRTHPRRWRGDSDPGRRVETVRGPTGEGRLGVHIRQLQKLGGSPDAALPPAGTRGGRARCQLVHLVRSFDAGGPPQPPQPHHNNRPNTARRAGGPPADGGVFTHVRARRRRRRAPLRPPGENVGRLVGR